MTTSTANTEFNFDINDLSCLEKLSAKRETISINGVVFHIRALNSEHAFECMSLQVMLPDTDMKQWSALLSKIYRCTLMGGLIKPDGTPALVNDKQFKAFFEKVDHTFIEQLSTAITKLSGIQDETPAEDNEATDEAEGNPVLELKKD